MSMAKFTCRLLLRVVHEPANGNAGEKNGRVRAYNREKNRLILVGLALDLVLGAVLAFGGISGWVRDRARSVTGNRIAARSLAVLGFGVIQGLIGLPLSYYRGYLVEQRYDLSNQTRVAWFVDQLKGLAVGLPLVLLITNAVYAIIGRWPRGWWAIVTALTLPFTALLSQLAPVLILPLFNKYEPLRDRELAKRLKSMAERSGIRVADVLQMDMSRQTRKANAFFTGLGRTRRIVLADTLLDNFSSDEIEVVVAHEIAHQAHRDIWRLIGMATIATAVSSWLVNILAGILLRRASTRVGTDRLADIASLPLLMWLLSIIGLILSPLQNAYSRKRERSADQFALALTDDPAAFNSTMNRLGSMNLADPSPSKLVKYALYSHPPIAERLEHGRRYAREHGLASDD